MTGTPRDDEATARNPDWLRLLADKLRSTNPPGIDYRGALESAAAEIDLLLAECDAERQRADQAEAQAVARARDRAEWRRMCVDAEAKLAEAQARIAEVEELTTEAECRRPEFRYVRTFQLRVALAASPSGTERNDEARCEHKQTVPHAGPSFTGVWETCPGPSVTAPRTETEDVTHK